MSRYSEQTGRNKERRHRMHKFSMFLFIVSYHKRTVIAPLWRKSDEWQKMKRSICRESGYQMLLIMLPEKNCIFLEKRIFFNYYFWPTWYSGPSMFFKSSKLYQAYSLAVGTAELKVLKWSYLKTLTWLFLWLNITLQWFPSPALGIEKVTLILCFASHRKHLDGRSQQFMWWKAIFWEHSLNCSLLIKNISVVSIGKFNRLFICGCLLM